MVSNTYNYLENSHSSWHHQQQQHHQGHHAEAEESNDAGLDEHHQTFPTKYLKVIRIYLKQ